MSDTTPFPSLSAEPAAQATARPSRRWTGAAGAAGAMLLLALAGWWGVSSYNQLQRSDVYVDYAWGQTINQYTRRSELVPNLVAVVRSYAAHETDLFRQIAATRATLASLGPEAAKDGARVAQFQAAQGRLAGQLSRLLLVAEKYPELKASSLYQDLMAQLEGSENRIAFARQQYLAGVADYNLAIRSFPGNLIAAQAGFRQRQAAAFADEARVRLPVEVDLK